MKMESPLPPKDIPDFSSVTETDGAGLTAHALAMNYHRYRLAADLCGGRDVLEVACGNGQGLGLLAKKAQSVVGGDFTESLVRKARATYQDRLPVLCFDGQVMPFRNRSFDVVVLFEAIYYLPDPDRFLAECRRVLRPNGTLLLSTVNREWSDFNPSPMSRRYFSARELAELLSRHGFQTSVLGAFPVEIRTKKDALVSWIKRMAVKLHLVPGSMKGKELLKKLFYGKLLPLPPELSEDMTEFSPPLELDAGRSGTDYRVIYAVGRLPETGEKAA